MIVRATSGVNSQVVLGHFQMMQACSLNLGLRLKQIPLNRMNRSESHFSNSASCYSMSNENHASQHLPTTLRA
jgi:hypothetical protein